MNDKQRGTVLRDDWEEIRGPLLTRGDVLSMLKEHPEAERDFHMLSAEFREELIAFAMGVQGAKITYDSFFKFIFDPVIYKENVEDFLTAVFDEDPEQS